jgi:hypothetical protein
MAQKMCTLALHLQQKEKKNVFTLALHLQQKEKKNVFIVPKKKSVHCSQEEKSSTCSSKKEEDIGVKLQATFQSEVDDDSSNLGI